MKKLLHLAILSLTFFSCVGNSIVSHPSDIPMGSVGIKFPEYEKRVLKNGLTLIFKQQEGLPLISGNLYLPTGYGDGNCGIPALGSVTFSQLREGGTKSYSPDRLDELLDKNAANIEASQGEEYSALGFSALSEDFPEIFKIFSEVVLNPRFDEDRLSLSKHLLSDEISRRKDDASTIAGLVFSYAMYGTGGTWYDPVTKDSIKLLKRSALQEYYNSAVSPKGAYLIVSGNIDAESFFGFAETIFGKWQDSSIGCLEKSPLVSSKGIRMDETKTPIYVVNRDFKQSAILLGHKSKTIAESDVYKTALFNRVFGSGSFDSLLFREIREKRGLAYGVSGGLSASKKRGTFLINLATRSAAVPEAIAAIDSVIEEVISSGFAKENIEGAIRASNQAFIFRFEDPEFAVSRPALLELSGMPEDYDQRFQDELRALSNNDLKEYAKSVISKEDMIIVVVGSISPQDLKDKIDGKDYQICEVSFEDVPELKQCF